MSDTKHPNFFLLGATKSGTTSLHYYLQQHSELFLTKQKEPHFFDSDNLFCRGLDWYLNEYYKGAENYELRGEATPSYFHLPDIVIPRMKEVFSNFEQKFIIILRNPVDRCWSHYLHRIRKGTEQEELHVALEMEEKRLKKDPAVWHGYYNDGLYCKLITKWIRQFPKENFLILLYEELKDIDTVLNKIFSFLNVSTVVNIKTNVQKNTASEARSVFLRDWVNGPSLSKNMLLKPFKLVVRSHSKQKRITDFIKRLAVRPSKERKAKIPEDIRLNLAKMYKNDIINLQNLIGRDLSHWL